jgi:hypothetical protein
MAVRISSDVGIVITGQPTPIANGGTGQSTAPAAINALLPNQAGNNGKVLGTDGTNVSWVAGGSGSPGGADTQIQFNDSGTLGGNAFLSVNKTTGNITSTGTLANVGLSVTGASGTNRTLSLQTAGSNRWLFQTNNVAETGSNAGSGLQLVAVADNGTTENTIFTISRITNTLDFKTAPTVNGQPIAPSPLSIDLLSTTYTYNVDSTVNTVTDVYTTGTMVSTYTYTSGNVTTAVITYNGLTRTETYTYDTNNKVLTMTAVIS